MNLNLVQIMGRVTRDIELKQLNTGTYVAQLSLAVNRVWYDQATKEKKEDVEFINCVAYGKTAENLSKYSGKGNILYVQGRLHTSSWDDRDSGKKMYRTEVIVENMQLPPRSMSSSAPREDDGSVDEADIDFGTSPTKKETPAKKKEVKGRGVKSISEDGSIDYGDADVNLDDIPF